MGSTSTRSESPDAWKRWPPGQLAEASGTAVRDAGDAGGPSDGTGNRSGGGLGFQVVRADQQLDADTLHEGEWVLAVLEGMAVAFLGPSAAVASLAYPSVLGYMAHREGGFVAKLDDFEAVFVRDLRDYADARVVVIDESFLWNRGSEFGIEPNFKIIPGLLDCPRGYDRPYHVCGDCDCGRAKALA